MAREIPLSQGKVAIVDDADFDRVAGHKWSYLKNNSGIGGYAARVARVNGKAKTVLLHAEIMQPTDGQWVNHINDDKLDCRRENLRITAPCGVVRSRRISRANSSGYKGVTFDRATQKWAAGIKIGNKQKNLGRFVSVRDAAMAYDEAARALFGNFACVNFPDAGEKGAR